MIDLADARAYGWRCRRCLSPNSEEVSSWGSLALLNLQAEGLRRGCGGSCSVMGEEVRLRVGASYVLPFYAKEVGAAASIRIFVFFRGRDRASRVARGSWAFLARRCWRCGVIAADLDGACSLKEPRGHNHAICGLCGLETTFEVRTYRSGEHDHHATYIESPGGAYADLCGYADLKRTDVEGAPEPYGRMKRLLSFTTMRTISSNFSMGSCSMLMPSRATAEALGVLVHAQEHAHLAVFFRGIP